MNLANDLERWTPAVFARSATGARPDSYGDARKLELPNSHLTVRLSSLYWQDSSPLDERDAITPILPVVATMADRRAGRDPVIEAILAFDAPAGAVHGAWRGELAAGYLRTPLSMRIAASERDLSGSVDMPVLGVNAAPLSALEQRGVDLSGLLMIGKRRVPFAARVAGTLVARARLRVACTRRRPNPTPRNGSRTHKRFISQMAGSSGRRATQPASEPLA